MIGQEKPPLELAHYGVKGMKWGVRNESDGGSGRNYKKAAIILGSAAGIAAVAAGAYYVNKNVDLSVLASSIPRGSASTPAKKFAESIAREPVGIVHAARGRSTGWTFPSKGGLVDPLVEYAKSGLQDSDSMGVWRYGDRAEKIAARILDPEGRIDRSGRALFHEFMIPEHIAKSLRDDADDVMNAVWPKVKDTYSAVYEARNPLDR